jgi:hypothetical protein
MTGPKAVPMPKARLKAPYTWAYPTPGILRETVANSAVTGGITPDTKKLCKASETINKAIVFLRANTIHQGRVRIRHMHVMYSEPIRSAKNPAKGDEIKAGTRPAMYTKPTFWEV